ncbi:N-acetyltransferase [Jeotgalibacillus sp. S-D1]|uniref:GNAT family N-acetyltransferase n=1 Tax=Jeotgalibacillus sp. S-D1 TaxID=2552189 RepID=UPI00105A26BA|nr:GNAT family protein [Jeotgalibacillus sp. S-D1]TDL35361.1 N-acetyltransferase [Jeotgalibacillus sp. S-D1]
MLLVNENIQLGPVYDNEFEKIEKWYLHESLVRRLDAMPYDFRTPEELKKWWREKDGRSHRFGIRLKQSDELIGFVELDGILWNHRNAWVSIAIGESVEWGKGYGKEAMECCIRYAFLELNLHRLQLTVFSYNESAMRLYAALGFTKEGVHREFIERNGKKHDMILYGLLRSEWDETIPPPL